MQEADGLDVVLWRYLTKEGADALPLKQRIPEVALFRGDRVDGCYFSNQRGLLQRRNAAEATRECILDRLLAMAARCSEGTSELGRTSPSTMTILRNRSAPSLGSVRPASGRVRVTSWMALTK